MTEYRHKIEEQAKAIQSEIKKNIQRTNSGGKEARIQINDLEHKEEINIQPEQKEETRIQENKKQKKWGEYIKTLGHLQKCQYLNHREEKEQETENLFEKIMKENFPNLVKEIDMQAQEAQSPEEVGPKEEHTKKHRNYITQD